MKSKNPLASFEVESNQGYSDFDGPAQYQDFPTHLSLPLPSGACAPDESLEVRDRDRKTIPSIVRPFVRWPDGSVRVFDIWFPLAQARGHKSHFELDRADPKPRHSVGETRAVPFAHDVHLSLQLPDGSQL